MGHEVYTPTLTGLGERVHLGRPETNLDTHIQDIVNVLFYEDLQDIVLASWSFGGMVAAGVADRVPERILHVIHVDGEVPEDGQAWADVDPYSRPIFEERARVTGEGWRVSVGDLTAFEERVRDYVPDDNRRRQLVERVTSQPLGTFLQPIRLSHRTPPIVRQTFVRCTRDTIWPQVYDPIAARLRARTDWDVRDIPATHFGPYAEPHVVSRVLHDLGR
jgi:pimeloyl-ACP methyl ester carboxylesterase